MDNVNYMEEYFLGNITFDDAINGILDTLDEYIKMYVAGVVNDCNGISDEEINHIVDELNNIPN